MMKLHRYSALYLTLFFFVLTTSCVVEEADLSHYTGSPIKKIFDKVVDTSKIVPNNITLNTNQKTKFRTDKLSKLSMEQRKFLGRIYEIINEVLDKKTAESLIKKIEEELK